jgi:hypothetical protein
MHTPDNVLDEFMVLYRDETGETMSREQAREIAQRLLTLYERLAQPLPGEHNPEATPPA